MAIASPCGQCGYEHSVSDALAGKRFRCKGCGEPVTVPASGGTAPPSRSDVPPVPRRTRPGEVEPDRPPRSSRSTASLSPASASRSAPTPPRPTAKPRPKPKPEDEWDSLLADQGEPIEEDEAKPVEKKPKKKKKRSSSSGGRGGVAVGAAAGGGLLVLLLVIRIGLKVLPALPGVLAGKAEWRAWSHPGGNIQVEMPAAPASRFVSGQQVYVGEVRQRFACSVGVAPLPPQAAGIPPEVMANQLMNSIDSFLKPNQSIQSRKRTQIQGLPAIEFQATEDSTNQAVQFILAPGKMIVLEFAYKTDYPEERARFFNSLKLTGL